MSAIRKVALIFCLIMAVYCTAVMVLDKMGIDISVRIARWRRRRKADARIIAQAKGAGVWDKNPIVLGGRALELKAWKDFRIKREPGEPDAHLRRRYMERLLDYVVWDICRIKRKPGETDEELRRRAHEEIDRKHRHTQTKGEAQNE